jgi:hypothetical protein
MGPPSTSSAEGGQKRGPSTSSGSVKEPEGAEGGLLPPRPKEAKKGPRDLQLRRSRRAEGGLPPLRPKEAKKRPPSTSSGSAKEPEGAEGGLKKGGWVPRLTILRPKEPPPKKKAPLTSDPPLARSRKGPKGSKGDGSPSTSSGQKKKGSWAGRSLPPQKNTASGFGSSHAARRRGELKGKMASPNF